MLSPSSLSERLLPLLWLRVSYLHPPFSFSLSSIPEKLRLRRLFFLAMKRIASLFQEQQEVKNVLPFLALK